MLTTLKKDLDVIIERDPAVKSYLEAFICYPGLHAQWLHRIAHAFYKRKFNLIARIINTLSRFFTNIDIHPGATIGEGLFIDHGLGVVIGETAIIGQNVTIYQGVTLGGTGKETGKRHPTIGDNVVISSGAKILGSFTVGSYSKIGAGSVVLKEVPPHSVVVGIPGRIVMRNGQRVDIDLKHDDLPDPIADFEAKLQDHMEAMEQRLKEIENHCCQIARNTVEEHFTCPREQRKK